MFGTGSRSSTHDIAKRIEALRSDVALLGEALADAAEETTRTPRRAARRYAGEAMENITSHAEEFGAKAGTLAASGLSAAFKAQRSGLRKLDGAAERTQEMVVRHPAAATLLAAIGVGLVAACVLGFAAQQSRSGTSRSGNVRRPLSKGR